MAAGDYWIEATKLQIGEWVFTFLEGFISRLHINGKR